MSDAPKSPPSSPPALPGSERPDYRGKCLYKTGKCMNERALKTSGTAHNLCDEHRSRQNQHQRKLDAKNRLSKRERRASAGSVKAPKSESSKEVLQTEMLGTAPAPVDAAQLTDPANAGLLGLASSASATTPPQVPQAPILATASSGIMYLPNGPQPPQVSYPFIMQDFDGIVVPLPSYLEGQERVEFRSRIYQKVLDFISEECILRFGAKVEQGVPAPSSVETLQTPETNSAGPGVASPVINEADVVALAAAPSERQPDRDLSDDQHNSVPPTEDSRSASTSKKVH
ncbi:hypothetical protein BBO99_00008482 [Phytophthora kernoviae]|uniref:Uncharacterized protein n=1 Tax=Phytophthora kernoviae TaxID=325452 RepID=A0A3R7JCZ9_9STRA|nr:hypothetical protein JM16_008508 [Phytophthora kernoviae]RLN37341.1 hypothetical protein BBI17_008438 [Phytophthora kernoviae]RLN75231.1 hypothetical protein BBO99_00008482 [Phytophthora kernoviae]